MPAADNPLKMSWIPAGPAKGGTFTNATYHDMVPDSTQVVAGSIVKNNAWFPFPAFVGYGFQNIVGPVTTLGVFNRYSGVTQSLTSSVIAGITTDRFSGTSAVWNQTTGATIRENSGPMATTLPGRYCFAAVKNRLYMANGVDRPAISPDATVHSCQPWGFSPQTPSLAYQIGAAGSANNLDVLGGTQGTCTVAGTTLTWATGPKFDYFNANAVIYVNGVYNTIASVTSTTVLQLTFGGAASGAFSYAPTGITGNAAYTGSGGIQATGNFAAGVLTWATGVNFSSILVGSTIYLNGVAYPVASVTSATTLTVTGAPAPGAYNLAYGTVAGGTQVLGLNTLTTWAPPTTALPALIVGPGPPPMTPPPGSPVFIAGAAAPATPTVKYSLTSVTGVAAALISPTYAEQTGGASVTRNTQMNFSNITFDQGRAYQYAVSYYNPTSGHVTNTSAVLNVKDGAPNNVNVSVTISNIVCNNDTNYTKIILWRSGVNSSAMYPLAILNNNTGNAAGSTITYTDFLGDDTALGTATGGPGKSPAPTGQNTPPPQDLNFIQYWDGRFWGASNAQIGILFFSARSSPGNPEDISVGVGEECWPPNFTRALPESDGRVTGLRTVGNNLYVLTDNNIYAMVGNNQTSYGLVRVSAKGHGTSHFATCVIPAEDVSASDVLVHFGNDGRLYFLFTSGGDYPISYPIQDQLDAWGATSSNVVVGVAHTPVSSYIYLNCYNGFPSQLPLYYDLERKIWVQAIATLGSGYVEGLVGGVLKQFYSDRTNNVGINSTAGSPATVVGINTNAFSPGASDRKSDKSLESVTVYTNEPAANVNVRVLVDSAIAGGGTTYTLVQVPTTGNYATVYHENADAIMFVPSGVIRGRLFMINVYTTGNPAGFTSAIYEIAATWSDTQSPAAKGANL